MKKKNKKTRIKKFKIKLIQSSKRQEPESNQGIEKWLLSIHMILNIHRKKKRTSERSITIIHF